MRLRLNEEQIRVVCYSILTGIPISELREHLQYKNSRAGTLIFNYPVNIPTRKVNNQYRSNLIASRKKKQINPYGRSQWPTLPENYTPAYDFDVIFSEGKIPSFPPLTSEQYQSQFRPPPSQGTSEQTEMMPTLRTSYLTSPPPSGVGSGIVPTAVSISRESEDEVTRILCNQRMKEHFFHYFVELSLDKNGNATFEVPGGGAFTFWVDSNVFNVNGFKRSAMLATYASFNTVDLGSSVETPAFIVDSKTLAFTITNGVVPAIYDSLIDELQHHKDRLGEDLKNATDAIYAMKGAAKYRGCHSKSIAIRFTDMKVPFDMSSGDFQDALSRNIHEQGLTPATVNDELRLQDTLDEDRQVMASQMA